MKRVRLYTKEVMPRDGKDGTEVQRARVRSVDLYKFALETNKDNLRGIERIMVVSKIIDKLNHAEDYVDLEDAEFDILKKSVNVASFPPVVLYFQEMFAAIKEAAEAGGMSLSVTKPGEETIRESIRDSMTGL